MLKAREILDRQYMEMRWRILSLAADFDRLQRAESGNELLNSSPQIEGLKSCIQELLSPEPGRAERVQLRLSDKTPPPKK